MKRNPLRNKSYSFALAIIEMYKSLIYDKQEYHLSKQLLKSGTSIGANVEEANGAISESDFSAKMSIAYKESLEAKYWLHLLKDSSFIEDTKACRLIELADELSQILYSILKSTHRIIKK